MIDYSEVLRDLTERRNELEAAIKALRRIAGLPAGPQKLETPHIAGSSEPNGIPTAPRQN